ncbi:hypothetical protein SCHPADRAFT_939807 [Schizopora paradoxa]|uniref:Uncharacterized protein n=1 Tax=Schizopora paradoxa TaxID=27342 RepID=A0A0H2SB57_9AGAM|nr:hypothetical protein SCHPADRAFT_939807 [Schizopora paradoxa]
MSPNRYIRVIIITNLTLLFDLPVLVAQISVAVVEGSTVNHPYQLGIRPPYPQFYHYDACFDLGSQQVGGPHSQMGRQDLRAAFDRVFRYFWEDTGGETSIFMHSPLDVRFDWITQEPGLQAEQSVGNYLRLELHSFLSSVCMVTDR